MLKLITNILKLVVIIVVSICRFGLLIFGYSVISSEVKHYFGISIPGVVVPVVSAFIITAFVYTVINKEK